MAQLCPVECSVQVLLALGLHQLAPPGVQGQAGCEGREKFNTVSAFLVSLHSYTAAACWEGSAEVSGQRMLASNLHQLVLV